MPQHHSKIDYATANNKEKNGAGVRVSILNHAPKRAARWGGDNPRAARAPMAEVKPEKEKCTSKGLGKPLRTMKNLQKCRCKVG